MSNTFIDTRASWPSFYYYYYYYYYYITHSATGESTSPTIRNKLKVTHPFCVCNITINSNILGLNIDLFYDKISDTFWLMTVAIIRLITKFEKEIFRAALVVTDLKTYERGVTCYT